MIVSRESGFDTCIEGLEKMLDIGVDSDELRLFICTHAVCCVQGVVRTSNEKYVL